MTTIESVPAFFDALPSRFHAERAQGMHAVYQFDVTGDGGGQWNATIADGRCDVQPGQAASADITLQVPAKEFLGIVNGTKNPQMAFMTGKLKVRGDLSLALRLRELFL
jgi:putative sterol carrier protein